MRNGSEIWLVSGHVEETEKMDAVPAMRLMAAFAVSIGPLRWDYLDQETSIGRIMKCEKKEHILGLR